MNGSSVPSRGATIFTLFGLLDLGFAALGADFKDLLWLVRDPGSSPSLSGSSSASGSPCGSAAVEPLLFKVSAHDPGVASAAVLALLAAAALASIVPALRVRRLDPAAVMRTE